MIKLKLFLAAVIIIVMMAGTIAVMQNQISRLKEDRTQLVEFAKTEQNKLTFYEGELKTQVAKVNQVTLSYNNLKELRETDRLSWVMQFDGIKKNLKNLETAVSTKAIVAGSFTMPLIKPDLTTNAEPFHPDTLFAEPPTYTFTNNDKWLQLDGNIKNDSVTVTANVPVPLQEVQHWQRKKFLGLRIGRKEYFSQITSANPYVEITNHEVIRAGKRKK